MKKPQVILILLSLMLNIATNSYAGNKVTAIDDYGDTLQINLQSSFSIPYNEKPTKAGVHDFYKALNKTNYKPLVAKLLQYKEQHQLLSLIHI